MKGEGAEPEEGGTARGKARFMQNVVRFGAKPARSERTVGAAAERRLPDEWASADWHQERICVMKGLVIVAATDFLFYLPYARMPNLSRRKIGRNA